MGHPFVVYTVLRLLVFAGAYGVLVLLGVDGFPGLLLALLISSIASLFLLRSQRRELARLTASRREARGVEKDRMRDMLRGEGDAGPGTRRPEGSDEP